MIYNKLDKNRYDNEEKIDSEEFSKELNKLSRSEQEKIFYMIKGAALVSESKYAAMAKEVLFNNN